MDMQYSQVLEDQGILSLFYENVQNPGKIIQCHEDTVIDQATSPKDYRSHAAIRW